MQKKKWRIGLAIMLVVTLAIDQGIQYIALSDGFFAGRRVAPYDPPLFFDQQQVWYDRLVSHMETGQPAARFFKLDPDLGWCPPANSGRDDMNYDWSGSRVGFTELPKTKTPGVQRIVAVGCSFTRGDEVGDTESWAALLDRDRDDLEIANLGVGGYGIDQALLRLRRDGWKLDPDEVWLGVLPLAALRTTTMYRPALRHWSSTPAFKPRFVVHDDDSLQLIENPARTLEDARRLLSSQEEFLSAIGEYDSWIREFDTCWQPRGSKLAHWSGLARLAITFDEAFDRSPHHLLHDRNSEVFRLMRALCLEARREVESRGKRFRLLLLPGRLDLYLQAQDGRGYWQNMIDDLVSEGVEVLDLCPALVDDGALDADGHWTAGQHYTPKGNAVVAKALSEWVTL